MSFKNSQLLDIVVIGSGIAGLNFIDKYLERGKKINVISPSGNEKNTIDKKLNIKLLPSQMRGQYSKIDNYFKANNLNLKSNCKAIGSLNFGGLSNYWGLQIDNFITSDQKDLKKKTLFDIKKNFIEFLEKFSLIGSFKLNGHIYDNEFNIPKQFNDLNKKKDSGLFCKKPILAFSTSKNFKGNLNNINEKKQKLTAQNFFKKMKNKKNIIIYDYCLEKISKKNGLLYLECKKNKKIKNFLAKKVVFASGTIATTKILMDYLEIKKEVKIKHHPRLLSLFFSKRKLKYDLSFTPSFLQIVSKSSNDRFTADLRPGNKLITKSIIDAFPFAKPFEFIINILRKRLIFSNFLVDSKYSNLFLKKNKKKFDLYSKNKNLDKILKNKNKKIFNFLRTKKIIFPIYKTFFPGNGADYHYFGSIPFQKKGKLAVNNNCQLLSSKNIYIVDGSVFNFRTNKYPLGIIAANARRVAKFLSR